jgi:hypothetical protein
VTLNIFLFSKNCSPHSNNAQLKLKYAGSNKHELIRALVKNPEKKKHTEKWRMRFRG